MRGLEWRVGRLVCPGVAGATLAIIGCGGGGGIPNNLPAVSPQTSGCVPGGGCGTVSAQFDAVAPGRADACHLDPSVRPAARQASLVA